jgi:hypothetical protein
VDGMLGPTAPDLLWLEHVFEWVGVGDGRAAFGSRHVLAVRDRGCVKCRAPVAWTEAHYVIHWADGGPTDLDNLVLLCFGCHRDIHERGWQPIRGPNGHWTLQPPASG